MATLSLKGISVLTAQRELKCEAIRDRVHLSVIRMPLPEDQKEQEEEVEEEKEVAIRALRRGPAGSAPRLACTIAIQLRMYHKTLVSLPCGADIKHLLRLSCW